MERLKYSLNPNAKIYTEVVAQKWWKLFSEDNDIYIHIRKDNYISVYYYGGSIAKIEYKKGEIIAHINSAYLNERNENGQGYATLLNLRELDATKLESIKAQIRKEHLKSIEGESTAEKWMQGDLITTHPDEYIDSEFAYYNDTQIGKLRIDVVRLSNEVLKFVELKCIYNNELRNDETKTDNPAHILEQMNRYANFIAKYKDDLLRYYQTVCDIRYALGLQNKVEVLSIDPNPHLLIFDTYKRYTKRRYTRIEAIKTLLTTNNIEFEICKSQSTEE
ncbi:MAG: hypothetical protein SNH55_02115 [Rikenellaceae bacterium]